MGIARDIVGLEEALRRFAIELFASEGQERPLEVAEAGGVAWSPREGGFEDPLRVM